MAPLIAQRDADHKDILGTVLKIQKDSPSHGTIVSAEKIRVGNSTAARFIYTESTDPKSLSFNEYVTFANNDSLAGLTFFTDNSIQPNSDDKEIFDAMLLTFHFKQ
jgi:hypothetical protein